MEEWKNEEDPRVGKGKGYFYGGLLVGMVLTFLIMAGAYVVLHRENVPAEKVSKENTEEEQQQTAFDSEVIEKLRFLEDAVYKYYYKTDLDEEALINGAYKGMLDALGDPYSVYYTPEELKDIMDQSSGIYYGIGAVVEKDKETNLTRINSVVSESPAEESGLRPGDLLYEIEGESTYGVDLTTVVGKIKGAQGSKVHITVIREGEDDYLEFEVERKQITSPTVKHEMYEDGIAYIQITEFDDVTVDQFAEALAVVKESGMTSLILDLRANPGGNLSAVVDIARMILPQGLIVYTEDREGKRMEYTCNGKRELNVPIAVLINGYSASASEILAGAIKDYGKGTLIGTTTFGKGIVQQIFSIGDGSAIKLTVSDYYTPSGKNIHGVGIEPDIEYEFDSDAYYGEEKFDNQLERAKEFLKTGK